MESTREHLKSLKDTLAEYAVFNFEDLFPHRDPTRVPTFPSSLFDEILEKSKDMCWPISNVLLEPCIKARDKLEWNETSILRFLDSDFRDDPELYKSIKHAPTTLKMCTRPSEEVHFRVISKAADTLEDLDLNLAFWPIEGTSMEIKNKHLKLKRLRLISVVFEIFPYTLDPKMLVELYFVFCKMTKFFLETLVSLKSLVHLQMHFCDPTAIPNPQKEVIQAVTSLKELRFLSLRGFGLFSEQMLNKIIKELNNLDILELEHINLTRPDLLLTPSRKLKALSTFGYEKWETLLPLTTLAQRIGTFGTLDGLMTIVSTTQSIGTFYEAVCKMTREEYGVKVDFKKLLEAEKKGIFNFRSIKRLTESTDTQPFRSSYDLPWRMTCYLLKKSPFCTSYLIREFVKNNDNTNLAKACIRYFAGYNLLNLLVD